MKLLFLVLAGVFASAGSAAAESETLPAFLNDRGPGIATSMFGTYVRPGELLVYPFFEYYRDHDFEYAPDEFGQVGGQDFRGDFEATEHLLFLAYGFSERFAMEIEGAFASAELEKSREDQSSLPAELVKFGVGDVEGQFRYRWAAESVRRPEVFSYFEFVTPTQPEGSLIGTTDWELKLGSGVTRGYRWGTVTARAAIGWERAEGVVDLGECAVEYLKRLSPRWRIYAGVEGTQDDLEGIGEVQWMVTRRMMLKLNSAHAITSKATDWAPEAGMLFSF